MSPASGVNLEVGFAARRRLTMTPDDGKPLIPTTSDDVGTRKVIAISLTVLGVVMVLLGLVHFAGLPLILEANKNGTINLPSIEDKGLGIHLLREQVANGGRRGQMRVRGDPSSLCPGAQEGKQACVANL